MTTDIVIDILKWVKKDLWNGLFLIWAKSSSITRNGILKFFLFAIFITSAVYVYFTYKTIVLVYRYSGEYKNKSEILSKNYIKESEFYRSELKKIPESFSKDFVEPSSVVYYQVSDKAFAVK